jgi:outer membrane protein assembly factor BamB
MSTFVHFFKLRGRIVGIALIGALNFGPPTLAGDWTMFGHDPARSGWANEETKLSPRNVSDLRLLWKKHVNNQSYSLSALTAPVAISNLLRDGTVRSTVYVAGIGGTVFSLDGETGEVLWTRSLRSMAMPGKGGFQGSFLCPNGITATPVIDRGSNTIYVIAPDGGLNGLDLESGKIKYGPVPFVAPFTKNWSLNLVGGTVYTTVSLGCGNGRSGVYAADIRNVQRPLLRQLFLSNAYTAGIWGRAGPVIGGNGKLYGGTADGDTDPANGDYSDTVISASIEDLSLSDYFLPGNFAFLKKKDLDVASASPVWFAWKGRNLIADGFKEGVLYLLDADRLGAQDHDTPLFASPRLGNDLAECCGAAGIWGALSTSRDEEGQTWLYVPMGGPPSTQAPRFPITNGDNPHGSIMAFKVLSDPQTQNPTLAPAWISGDFHYPDPAAIANGVVFALSNGENPDQRGDESRRLLNTRPAVLKALDAKTGKELYNSGAAVTTWAHFSGLAIANGRIYAVDHDSNVYCFGIPDRNAANRVPASRLKHDQDQLSSSWIGRAERQEEFWAVWIKRAGGAAALVILTAILGICAGLKSQSKSD